MSYISPKHLFIDESLAAGCDLDDTLFLANLEFDENGEVKPGTIYATYRKPQ